ncbi:hypothetical protein E3N88_44458 [Mikania micrantha]|uniref:Uncharacterized protein n=1 Tax=Mikania micrantha TaxID=192012 RepID=A0A5N6LBZ7_9ASTR|nr:hypothetical protein E3N88_44458 [Mikania micrantha]
MLLVCFRCGQFRPSCPVCLSEKDSIPKKWSNRGRYFESNKGVSERAYVPPLTAVCGESRTYGNEGVRVYTCSVVVGPTHPICSMIYGSTGATHFDQLAKILTGYEITGARSSGRELGSERRETVRSISGVGVRALRGPFPSTRGPGRTHLWCPQKHVWVQVKALPNIG